MQAAGLVGVSRRAFVTRPRGATPPPDRPRISSSGRSPPTGRITSGSQGVATVSAPAHMALGVGEPMRRAVRPQPAGLGQRARIAPIGLELPRPGRVLVAKFGSATITSWPSRSSQRATHSLSVEASRRMRARGRSPRTSANRAGWCARAARAARRPRSGCRAGFPSCARRCQYGPWLAPSACGLTADHSVGQRMPPRRVGSATSFDLGSHYEHVRVAKLLVPTSSHEK